MGESLPSGNGAGQGLRATVLRYYECVDGNDLDGLLAAFAEDATYRRPGYPPLEGHGDLRRFYDEQRILADGSHTIRRCLEVDGEIAVSGKFEGSTRDGSAVEIEFADFFTGTSDHLIRERQSFFFVPAV